MNNMTNGVFKHETTGTLMKEGFIALQDTYTAENAISHLRKNVQGRTNIHYLYILNSDSQLIGVLSIRELLGASDDEWITNIMETDIISFPTDLDQEEAAKVFRDKDLVSIPVVNRANQLIGVIHVEEILDVIQQEADEDIRKLSASGKEIDFRTNPFVAAWRRLPWLVLLLFIGLISGGIIERFEATLEAVVALAFFMPMIAGMTGNTGTQSLAVVVRGLVSEDITFNKSMKLLFRELIVGIIIGITCAIVIAIIAFVWRGSLTLGLVVGSSLLATLIIGTLAGTVIPLLLYKFKVDPAVASGPLITTINDILSLLIYFGIATIFISKLM
ncbi:MULTISPECIES: magnesium transporter [Sporosarcina]|uniref:Magnesium transporter MgtE n=1 Tax=Sporosarcina newyorkensis TaxID=759851 RepID=A0A1T4YZE8_9BACL|nr:magnesium transporter [Sporosarcina newyorkensis]SKB07116.1 magnesium transporter [Sporosarcina newyorkensis]